MRSAFYIFMKSMKLKKYFQHSLLSGMAMVFASSHCVAAETTAIVGLDYTQGTYGTSTMTKQWAAPLGVKYEAEAGYVKVMTAYLSVANVNPNSQGESLACGNSASTPKDVQGIGDTTVSLMKHVWDQATLQLDAGVKIKFATGDVDKCLSTGKHDLSLQLDSYKTMGKMGLFGTVGWTYKGKPQIGGQTIEYRNPIYASAGITTGWDEKSSIGASFDYREKLLESRSSLQEMSFFAIRRVSPTLRVQPYLMKGFTASSPDIGIGVNILSRY